MTKVVTSIFASAVRSATTNSTTITNYTNRGGHIIIDVTAVPGIDTVTPTIQGFDPISGKFYDILVGTALVATGTVVLKVFPGIASSANASANDFLPLSWRVVMTHSALTNFTYSISANLGA